MSIILVQTLLHITLAANYLLAGWKKQHFIGVAVALHLLTIIWQFNGDTNINLGTLISLLFLGTISVVWRGITIPTVQKILTAATAIASLAPLIIGGAQFIPTNLLHVNLSILAYIAAIASFFYWLDIIYAEKLLKQQPSHRPQSPLLTREKKCIYYVLFAFICLTLTLASGFYNAHANQLPLFDTTHKNIFAICTWLTFLILLLGRYLLGWRGKRALTYYFIGLVFLTLSYLVSSFILNIVLG